MAKKITLLEVNNFKRLKSVLIEPGDTNLMLIGGKNTNGKSSLLGAISAAIGGGREVPEDPIHHGEKSGSIRVVYDDGDLIVRRKFTAKGSTLEVTDATGKIKSPQKRLDALIGKRFIDPMKFSRLTSAEQRNTLIGCVDLEIDLDASMAAEKAAYDKRRDLKRDLKRLEAKAEALSPVSIPDRKDAKELIANLESLREAHRAYDARGMRIKQLVEGIETIEKKAESAKEAFLRAREAYRAAREDLELIPEMKDQAKALSELEAPDSAALEKARAELDECAEHNEEVARQESAKLQADATREEILELSKEVESLTVTIESEKHERIEALESAPMPIEGLSFCDDGLLLFGAPFHNASGAQRLRASIAIASALSPELLDVWVEDGALLDEDHLEMVREYAEANGLRVWLERVGEGDEDAIIIRDGMVAGGENA